MNECTATATEQMQIVNAILNALQIGLVTFLAHRRIIADRERHQSTLDGKQQSGSQLTQKDIDGSDSSGQAGS